MCVLFFVVVCIVFGFVFGDGGVGIDVSRGEYVRSFSCLECRLIVYGSEKWMIVDRCFVFKFELFFGFLNEEFIDEIFCGVRDVCFGWVYIFFFEYGLYG